MKKIIIGLFFTLFLLSCGNSSTDLINPEANFQYFYGATCPHCQELNRRIESSGGIEQYSVEKREVYYNRDNQTAFQNVIRENNIDQRDAGVPFVFDKSTGRFAVWVDAAFAMITWAEGGLYLEPEVTWAEESDTETQTQEPEPSPEWEASTETTQ